MPDSPRLKVRELEEKFYLVKMNYYRFVIRNEDRKILSKFVKIPEDWENYLPAEGTRLNEDVKSRLNDVKKKKSWELKLESLYLFYITEIENSIIAVLQQKSVKKQEIDDIIDSLNSLILELDGDLLNFKYLMLTLAKRSVSDLYYILGSYSRFFYKRNFTFETDVKIILGDFVKIFAGSRNNERMINRFSEFNDEIVPLFTKSSNQLGWRMNEFAVKEYLDNSNQLVKIAELNRIAKDGFEYKKSLALYFSFLKYYYNENDGKLFRLNFISDSLKSKLDEGKISSDIYDSYEEIKVAFREYKIHFEGAGLLEFGPEKMSYIELVDFIYRVSKIIEFYYLRKMKHEQLQAFRNEIFYYVEKEIFTVKG